MLEAASGPGVKVGLTPTAIAGRLEETIDRLSKGVGGEPDALTPEEFGQCLEALKRICSAVRELALVYDPTRTEELAKRDEELKAIVVAISESIRALAGVNRRIAEKVGGQIQELDAIAKLPPGRDVVVRLRKAVISVRDAAKEMDERITSMSEELEKAHERAARLEEKVDEAQQRSRYDSLTRIYSRGALDERLATMMDAEQPWSVLLLDLDRFKTVNDRYGHIVGDALLFKLSRVIEDMLQTSTPKGFFARYGGEEFTIILPGMRLAEALEVARSVRETVGSTRWRCQGVAKEPVLTATVSIGVAERRPGDTVTSLVQRADGALYCAKRAGRNMVCVEEA